METWGNSEGPASSVLTRSSIAFLNASLPQYGVDLLGSKYRMSAHVLYSGLFLRLFVGTNPFSVAVLGPSVAPSSR